MNKRIQKKRKADPTKKQLVKMLADEKQQKDFFFRIASRHSAVASDERQDLEDYRRVFKVRPRTLYGPGGERYCLQVELDRHCMGMLDREQAENYIARVARSMLRQVMGI